MERPITVNWDATGGHQPAPRGPSARQDGSGGLGGAGAPLWTPLPRCVRVDTYHLGPKNIGTLRGAYRPPPSPRGPPGTCITSLLLLKFEKDNPTPHHPKSGANVVRDAQKWCKCSAGRPLAGKSGANVVRDAQKWCKCSSGLVKSGAKVVRA